MHKGPHAWKLARIHIMRKSHIQADKSESIQNAYFKVHLDFVPLLVILTVAYGGVGVLSGSILLPKYCCYQICQVYTYAVQLVSHWIQNVVKCIALIKAANKGGSAEDVRGCQSRRIHLPAGEASSSGIRGHSLSLLGRNDVKCNDLSDTSLKFKFRLSFDFK